MNSTRRNFITVTKKFFFLLQYLNTNNTLKILLYPVSIQSVMSLAIPITQLSFTFKVVVTKYLPMYLKVISRVVIAPDTSFSERKLERLYFD